MDAASAKMLFWNSLVVSDWQTGFKIVLFLWRSIQSIVILSKCPYHVCLCDWFGQRVKSYNSGHSFWYWILLYRPLFIHTLTWPIAFLWGFFLLSLCRSKDALPRSQCFCSSTVSFTAWFWCCSSQCGWGGKRWRHRGEAPWFLRLLRLYSLTASTCEKAVMGLGELMWLQKWKRAWVEGSRWAVTELT